MDLTVKIWLLLSNLDGDTNKVQDWFQFKDVKTKLQSFATWTRKPGKNLVFRQAWLSAVKRRFESVLLMLDRILAYRKVLTFCYGLSPEVDPLVPV